ncbi:Extended synaptotagmin-3 [Desmophyllum pertusum]|uniref:Extended synaptotagmin-3 n=1 Tax=Desmophyllum pertusum TaxID=174260 RepID=A0A9W9YSV4_9CNID|nr:Extended synaptotagmin-3 [Desmophyllum pertusum]
MMEDSAPATPTAPKPAYKRILHNLKHISRDETKELLLCLAVTLSLWLVGHFHFSFAWIIMILMVFVSWEYQMDEKQKRRDRMEKAVKSSFFEKVHENLEKAEWVNSIIDQMWPYVDGMVYKILKETVEPEMQKNMPKALNTLYFETIDLGNKPPYVASVTSYASKEERKDEYIFDMDFVYSGDATIKLAIKSFKLGLSNIELRGILRVIFKPLVAEYNPVGGVTVFFLNRPKLKFDLTNLLNVLDIPGLKSSLRRITDDVIASFVVLPNRIAVPLAAGVEASDLQYPIPEGVLRVKVVEARDLTAKDFGLLKKGKSDPYAVIRIGAQSFRTKVIENNLNPEWNETFEAFVDNCEGQELEAVIYDEDTTSKDSKIGALDTDIASTVESGYRDLWLPLEGVKQGRVHLQLRWFPLTSSASDLEPPQENYLSVAALFVKPISANALPMTSGQKEALRSVYCEITVGKTTLQTFQCYGEKTEWKQAMRFLVSDPEGQEAEIKVIEAKGTMTLGQMSFNIRSLLNKDGLAVEGVFPLEKSGDKSTLTCLFTLKILNTVDVKPSEPETR